MSGVAKKLMGTTAAGGGFTAIEDVFSTYLYHGSGAPMAVTNGIDLAGEGGLVWLKPRDDTGNEQNNWNALYDTERGIWALLSSNSTLANTIYNPQGLSAFNSDGFSLGMAGAYGHAVSGIDYASWTFRKAPRFFDVVTYTGNGVAGRVINHNLGCDVGTVIIKQTNASRDWAVWHRSGGVNPGGKLNSTEAFGYTWVSSTSTTSITLENEGIEINGSGQTYVAYLFAHDPLGPSGDGSDGLIACGSYTGTGAAGNVVSLGWEPQWVLIKSASTGDTNWQIYDTMRGWVNGSNDSVLYPNASTDEQTAASGQPEATGFTAQGPLINTSGQTYIYIAIRRGPMRAPTSGTEVFAPVATGVTNNPQTGFPLDLWWLKARNGSELHVIMDRMRGTGKYLSSDSTAAEGDSPANYYRIDNMTGGFSNGGSFSQYIHWGFRRAPGFFDVVAYSGNSVVGRTVPHNLGVAPEMIWVKNRSVSGDNWVVYAGTDSGGTPKKMFLNLTNSWSDAGDFNNTEPTAESFTVAADHTVNNSGENYIAYLFATLPGVSKVGSYTGNGTSQTIDCGFTSGARFVLIKRSNNSGGWYVWDTTRGIVAGDDPFLQLNATAAELTGDDSIDPASSGFVVNQTDFAAMNVSGGEYIFLAIA